MVKVQKASASQVEYNKERDPFFSPEDNTWHGKGLEAVGLEDGQRIDYDDYQALYVGIHPMSSDQAGEQTIPLGGYDTYEQGHHKAGLNCLISPNKSVSIGFALDLEGIAEAAHDAMDATVDFMQEFAVARRKVDGVEHEEPTGNLIDANFNHAVTRSNEVVSGDMNGEETDLVPDCHLHRHVTIINATIRETDGKEELVSLKSTPFFENQGATDKSILNQFFNVELAANLCEKGYGVEIDANGNTDLAGIPQQLIDLHSKRSQAIADRAEEMQADFGNAAEGKIRQLAAYDTRNGKSSLSPDEIRASWDTQLEQAGLNKVAIVQSVLDAGKEQQRQAEERLLPSPHDVVRFAASELADEKVTFSKKELLAESFALVRDGSSHATDITEATQNLVNRKELVAVDGEKTFSMNTELTTKEVAARQKDNLELVGSGYVERLMTGKEAQQALFGYIKEQRQENPEYRMSQADYDIAQKVLTSSSPNLFLHTANEMERQKALDVVQAVMDTTANRKTELIGNIPATDQQHNAAVESIKRDLSRDAALNELDRKNSAEPSLEGMFDKGTIDRIRQESLNDAAGSFNKAGDRAVAEQIAAGTEDRDIFKATGASHQNIENIRTKLYEDAAYRAGRAFEDELDKKTTAEKESHYARIETVGQERTFKHGEHLTGTADARASKSETHAVLTVEGGKEELLYREKRLEGQEVHHDKHFRMGMLTYSVKRLTSEEKELRQGIDIRNEEIRARKLEDAKNGVINTEKLLDNKEPGWNVSIGGNRHYTSWGGSHVTKTNQKVWFGADKGNTTKRHRTEHMGSYSEKLKTYDAKSGVTRTIKSTGSKVALGSWTLFETKTSKIKEVDKDGRVTNSTSKTFKFMGSVTTRKITKNPDGTITETTIKGYEKTDLFGRKSLVITGKESVTKEAKPSLFATVAMSLIGGKSQPLADYASRAAERGKLVQVTQEGKSARSQHKFNSVGEIAAMAATADYSKTSVLTYSRGRANDINQAVRKSLQEQGIIGRGQKVEVTHAIHAEGKIGARAIELAAGDKVKLTDTSKGLGIKAGESGILRGIDEKGNVHISLDKPRMDKTSGAKKGKPVSEVFFNLRDYKAIDYNYASTSLERTTAGKLVVDYHTNTANKDFLASIHKSIKDHGGDIRIATDKPEMARVQMQQYDTLKNKYVAMVAEERQSSDLIGKTAVVVRQAGRTKFSITNARVVDFDHDANTVRLRHKDAKGVVTTRTYSADRVRVDNKELKLPESQVKNSDTFKDTVFARLQGLQHGQQMGQDKSPGSEVRQQQSGGAEKTDSGIVITKAQTRILSPLQAERAISVMEKENRSANFTVVDADRLPPQAVKALVRDNERQGARTIIIGDSKEVLGKTAEKLQDKGKGENIINISKHPDISNQKSEMISKVAVENARNTIEKVFNKLESSGSISEVNSKENLIKVAMQEFSGKIELGKTTIMAEKYADKIALHNAIREELKSQGQSGGVDTAINVQQKGGQQRTFMVDAAEHGVGPAVVNALVSAVKGGDVKIITTDKAGLQEQVFQVLSKGFDTRTQEQKNVEIPRERQERQESMTRAQVQQQRTRTRDLEIGG